jgi:hypothetical protein
MIALQRSGFSCVRKPSALTGNERTPLPWSVLDRGKGVLMTT